jgi:potassium efflux system protein
MRQLLLKVLGWLGYLERGPVLLQVLLLLALVLASRVLEHRRLPRGLAPPLQALLGPLAALLVAGLLGLLGYQGGLLRLLAQLWLGWSLLGLIDGPLRHWLPAARVHQLQSRLLRPLYLMAAGLTLVNRLGNARDLALIPLGRLFNVPVTLGTVTTSLLVSYLLLVGSGPPAAGLAWVAQRGLGISNGTRKALELLLSYSVVGIGITALCFHLGLSSTALLTIAGGLSVGLGFGIKEVFSNFVSGLWLLFEGSVRPGEVLMIDGDPCEVRRLGLRATLLWRNRDNAELLIPNQRFFTEKATTYTASDRMRRSEVTVGVAHKHDPVLVIALLEATARTVPGVEATPPPCGLLLSYDAFAITYSLRFWITNPLQNVGICSAVNQAIWHTFQREGIEIPMPWPTDGAITTPPPGDREKPPADPH